MTRKDSRTIEQWLILFFVLLASIIFIDFTLPGKVFTEEKVIVKRERQNYYNAARNYHYAYSVTTSRHEFTVDEEFARSLISLESIEYSVSRIFKEVNWYRIASEEEHHFHSLRVVSGLVLPLLSVILLFMVSTARKDLSTIIFVIQAFLVADLVYLLL